MVVPVGGLGVLEGEGTLTAVGLGSCIAVVLNDPGRRIGGLAHVLLPAPPPGRRTEQPARYAQSAVPLLLEALVARGAARQRLTARLVGGASMFAGLLAPGTMHIGERNTLAARVALHAAGVRLVGEWVGADFGRTVELDVRTGEVRARSVVHGTRQL